MNKLIVISSHHHNKMHKITNLQILCRQIWWVRFN